MWHAFRNHIKQCKCNMSRLLIFTISKYVDIESKTSSSKNFAINKCSNMFLQIISKNCVIVIEFIVTIIRLKSFATFFSSSLSYDTFAKFIINLFRKFAKLKIIQKIDMFSMIINVFICMIWTTHLTNECENCAITIEIWRSKTTIAKFEHVSRNLIFTIVVFNSFNVMKFILFLNSNQNLNFVNKL